jgi:hypothetical protein
MLTIIPHDALTGELNIIGSKLGFPVNGAEEPTPGTLPGIKKSKFESEMMVTTSPGEENEETLRDAYTEKFESS